MRHRYDHLLIIALLAALVLCATPVVAQDSPVVTGSTSELEDAATEQSAEDYFMSEEHRLAIYDARRKRPVNALLLSLALPGLGNVYARQYLVGGIALTFMVFSGVFITYGFSTSQPDIATTGFILAGGTYVGATTIALVGVSDYNRDLRRALKIEGLVLDEVFTPALAIRF